MLVNTMASASLPPENPATSAYKPYDVNEKTPSLPPRQNTTTTVPDRPSSVAPATQRILSSSRAPAPPPRSPPIANGLGITGRASAFIPSASTLAAFQNSSKRAPPPIPRPFDAVNYSDTLKKRDTSPSPSLSPSITPSSTGDYVVVTSASASRRAPPLPPRSTPTPKASLDTHSCPPKGVSLVSPDTGISSAAPTYDPPFLANKPPPPAVPNRSPLTAADPQREEKKVPPPKVPKKPAALRSISTSG